MPNIKVISSPKEPVNTEANVYYTQLAADGIMFNAPTGTQSVPANGYLSYQLTIPANINKTIYIVQVAGGATVNSSVAEFKNGFFAASGTAITPVCTKWSQTGGSSCTVKYLSQVADPLSGGTLLQSFVAPGGTLAYRVDGRDVISSSSSARTFYVRVTNRTNQANLCAIGVTWWEV